MLNYADVSKKIAKIAPQLPTMRRVYLAAALSDLYQYGHSVRSFEQITAIIGFLKICSDITPDQFDRLNALHLDAETHREVKKT